jgi:hypothetical protein
MYLHLFNAVTDSLVELERMNYGQAYHYLKQAQQACEEMFLDGEEEGATE